MGRCKFQRFSGEAYKPCIRRSNDGLNRLSEGKASTVQGNPCCHRAPFSSLRTKSLPNETIVPSRLQHAVMQLLARENRHIATQAFPDYRHHALHPAVLHETRCIGIR